MAATPPLQITGSPQTPLTPLHGATYDHEDSPRRTSARLRQKRAFEEIASKPTSQPKRTATTPNTPRKTARELLSPDQTPQRKPTARRVQIMSPTSPDSDSSASKPTTSTMSRNQFLSTSAALNEGMLPTPVKTPNKKHKTINKSNIAARALFQDPAVLEEMANSPRRSRKTKRHNGFSLESFRADNGEGSSGIQIFTDSRDQIPEVDKDDKNPFIDPAERVTSAKKVVGTTKRRKVSESKKMDPQVEEALEDDEGMVYVFRGKKVYRRFDDTGEEEEEIDGEDLGLLERTPGGTEIVKPLRTLTRKSIRPTRLFQTAEQKRARELEKEEEAAATDIEAEDSETQSISKGKGRSTRTGHKINHKVNGKTNGKTGSPFDSWPRVKPGSASSSSGARTSKGRKRTASESFEEPLAASA